MNYLLLNPIFSILLNLTTMKILLHRVGVQLTHEPKLRKPALKTAKLVNILSWHPQAMEGRYMRF